jgi:integrase
MRWADLDLDAAELTITGSGATIGAVRVEGTTKGGRSRVVSLDRGAARWCGGSRATGPGRLCA